MRLSPAGYQLVFFGLAAALLLTSLWFAFQWGAASERREWYKLLYRMREAYLNSRDVDSYRALSDLSAAKEKLDGA